MAKNKKRIHNGGTINLDNVHTNGTLPNSTNIDDSYATMHTYQNNENFQTIEKPITEERISKNPLQEYRDWIIAFITIIGAVATFIWYLAGLNKDVDNLKIKMTRTEDNIQKLSNDSIRQIVINKNISKDIERIQNNINMIREDKKKNKAK